MCLWLYNFTSRFLVHNLELSTGSLSRKTAVVYLVKNINSRLIIEVKCYLNMHGAAKWDKTVTCCMVASSFLKNKKINNYTVIGYNESCVLVQEQTPCIGNKYVCCVHQKCLFLDKGIFVAEIETSFLCLCHMSTKNRSKYRFVF